MKRWLLFPSFRLTVVLALIVALIGTAWGHRGSSNGIPEDVLAYVAAGGSLDDLCGPEGSAEFAHQTCDACRLVDAVSLAGVTCSAVPLAVLAEVALLLPDGPQSFPSVHDPVRQSRAPPRLI